MFKSFASKISIDLMTFNPFYKDVFGTIRSFLCSIILFMFSHLIIYLPISKFVRVFVQLKYYTTVLKLASQWLSAVLKIVTCKAKMKLAKYYKLSNQLFFMLATVIELFLYYSGYNLHGRFNSFNALYLFCLLIFNII